MENRYEAVGRVSVKSLLNNIKHVRALARGAKVLAVVKSDAYGHGIYSAVFTEGLVDGFCVSDVFEGMRLRFLGVSKPIIMLKPTSIEHMRIAARYFITPLIDSLKTLDIFLSLKLGGDISIKVDTGMNRFGFQDLSLFYEALMLAKSNGINVSNVFSHFYCAQNRTICDMQYQRFIPYVRLYRKSGFIGQCHIAASGGLLISGYELDAVRIGLLIYGYTPFQSAEKFEKALVITAAPHLTKSFSGGENALYNNVAPQGTFGLVDYGYSMLFRQNDTDISGCMESSFVKLNGDEAVILDDAEIIAKRNHTITYDVLTRVRGIKKIYINTR